MIEAVVPDRSVPEAALPYTELLTDKLQIEHARLKDHVANMTGGLEAKINEGYVIFL